tara:strand:- start:868 stop:1449 length:582 start_codon:yes stop_codon:yes gene_type:complete
MNKIYFFIFYFISISICAQDEVSADWSISINGNEVTISIVEFNNFTVGLDGHWHYILNDEDYVAVHDINDVILSNLADGNHSLFIWLVDHMHNTLNPPVEEIIEFSIDTGLSTNENEKIDMVIYPNPVDGNYVTILSPSQGLKEIEVYSVTGRKVIDTAINGSTLDVSSLNTGFYLLKVAINGQNKVSKLVVR